MAIAAEEAILELKPIEVVQRELEALAPQPRAGNVEKVVSTEVNAPLSGGTEPAPASNSKQEAVEFVAPQSAESIAYQPFTLWISNFQPPVLEPKPQPLPEIPAPAAEEAEAAPTLSAQELAERSVAENKDVISETLARLLAKQGYRDKAINMYERLRLAFPEKSAYFAAEIEKLKK